MKTIKKAMMGNTMSPMMKKGGVMKKAQYGVDMTAGTKKMAKGGSLKAVDKAKNPGLAKLPTPVRNKMGFAKKGASVKKKAGMHKMPDGSMMKDSKMKMGGKMKACKYGCN